MQAQYSDYEEGEEDTDEQHVYQQDHRKIRQEPYYYQEEESEAPTFSKRVKKSARHIEPQVFLDDEHRKPSRLFSND